MAWDSRQPVTSRGSQIEAVADLGPAEKWEDLGSSATSPNAQPTLEPASPHVSR